MSPSPTPLPQDRAYSFPWSMPDPPVEKNQRRFAYAYPDDRTGNLLIHEAAIDLWLREFRDERTGGYAPPPMS